MHTKRQKEGEESTDSGRDSGEKKKRLKSSSISVMTDTAEKERKRFMFPLMHSNCIWTLLQDCQYDIHAKKKHIELN